MFGEISITFIIYPRMTAWSDKFNLFESRYLMLYHSFSSQISIKISEKKLLEQFVFREDMQNTLA